MSTMLQEPFDTATPDTEACVRCYGDLLEGGFDGLCAGCLSDSCADCLAPLAGEEGVDDGRCHGCLDAETGIAA